MWCRWDCQSAIAARAAARASMAARDLATQARARRADRLGLHRAKPRARTGTLDRAQCSVEPVVVGAAAPPRALVDRRHRPEGDATVQHLGAGLHMGAPVLDSSRGDGDRAIRGLEVRSTRGEQGPRGTLALKGDPPTVVVSRLASEEPHVRGPECAQGHEHGSRDGTDPPPGATLSAGPFAACHQRRRPSRGGGGYAPRRRPVPCTASTPKIVARASCAPPERSPPVDVVPAAPAQQPKRGVVPQSWAASRGSRSHDRGAQAPVRMGCSAGG